MHHIAKKPTNRQDQIKSFLIHEKLENAMVTFLAGDASYRKYYRLTLPQDLLSPYPATLLLMDAPPPENPQAFIQIAQFLKDHGFSAPSIITYNLKDGFVLLEDFGNQTYTTSLTQNNTEELYFLAIDTLIHIHRSITKKPDFLAPYSTEIHIKEATLLVEWYYEAIYGHPLADQATYEYQSLWRDVLSKTTKGPQSIVLRDYHVDNLMVLDNQTGTKRCGLLDFQDALWGSVTYDIVSLLEDARRDVGPELVEKGWLRYGERFPDIDLNQLKAEGAILSAARHAKIIGIFTRLAVRDNKTHYLNHISRVWRLLEECLVQPALSDLQKWFKVHFPERGIPHV